MKKYIFGIAAIATLACGAGAAFLAAEANVFAQGGGESVTNKVDTLEISPVRTDLTLNPGETGSVDMRVTNLTNNPVTVNPIQNDFVAANEEGAPALILDASKFAPTHSLKRFMLPVEPITIPAKGFKEIKLNIKVPADADAGGYYGAVRFAPASDRESRQVNLNASAASLVFLTVPGDLVEQLNLTNFDITGNNEVVKRFLSSPENVGISFRFENKGNVQVAPFGQIYVKKGDEIVYTNNFNQEDPQSLVLPDSARQWDVPLKNFEKFGRYTVGATFTYGSTNKSINISKPIWIIPTWYIIAAVIGLIVLIALIIGIVFFLRSYKKKILRSHGRGLKM